MKETLKILETLQGPFSLDVAQVIILVHSFKKVNKELVAKLNLSQTRLIHASESYTFNFTRMYK